jgi:phosphoglycerol transferase MdoB-like AlkP superfamily enzyme
MPKSILFSTLAILITFFLLVLADLIPFWMPMMGEMIALLVVTVLLLGWAGLIVSESARDEREVYIKSQSGRVAYVAGLLALVVALVMQGMAHSIDPWIPVVLAVMVSTKLLARLYLDHK